MVSLVSLKQCGQGAKHTAMLKNLQKYDFQYKQLVIVFYCMSRKIFVLDVVPQVAYMGVFDGHALE